MKKTLFNSILCAVILSASVCVTGCGSTVGSGTDSTQESSQTPAFVNIEPDTTYTVEETELPENVSVPETTIPTRDLCTLEISDEVSCYHKTLNSVDYFNYASGIIETNMLNGDYYTIEYNVDMVNNESYQHVKSSDFDEEIYSADGVTTTIDNTSEDSNNVRYDLAYCEADDIAQNMEPYQYRSIESDARRITTDENGIKCYHYRQNPTNLHYASTFSLFPQEMIFGFLSNQDLWEIKGTDEYLGREVTFTTGTTEPDYGSKLNIDNFIMYFDNKTGIMLLFEGYDAAGNLTEYSKTTEFSDTQKAVPLFTYPVNN